MCTHFMVLKKGDSHYSHGNTEPKRISSDTPLKLEGISALILWGEISRTTKLARRRQSRQKSEYLKVVILFLHMQKIPSHEACLFLFEDNHAAINMIMIGRSSSISSKFCTVLAPSINQGPPLFVRTGQVLFDGPARLEGGSDRMGAVHPRSTSTVCPMAQGAPWWPRSATRIPESPKEDLPEHQPGFPFDPSWGVVICTARVGVFPDCFRQRERSSKAKQAESRVRKRNCRFGTRSPIRFGPI